MQNCHISRSMANSAYEENGLRGYKHDAEHFFRALPDLSFPHRCPESAIPPFFFNAAEDLDLSRWRATALLQDRIQRWICLQLQEVEVPQDVLRVFRTG